MKTQELSRDVIHTNYLVNYSCAANSMMTHRLFLRSCRFDRHFKICNCYVMYTHSDTYYVRYNNVCKTKESGNSVLYRDHHKPDFFCFVFV